MNVPAGSDGSDGKALVYPAAMMGCAPLGRRVGRGDDLPPHRTRVRTARVPAFHPQPRSDHVCASCTAAMMRKCIQYAINVSLLIGLRLHTGLPGRGLGPECRTLSHCRRCEGGFVRGGAFSRVGASLGRARPPPAHGSGFESLLWSLAWLGGRGEADGRARHPRHRPSALLHAHAQLAFGLYPRPHRRA